MQLEKICLNVCQLARETGLFIKQEGEKIKAENVEVKGLNNFVTYVDKNAEAKIVEGLKKLLPEAGFIAEEGSGTEVKGGLNWIIDPLDGTTNFIHGMPPHAVSIGLADGEELLAGVVYEVKAEECFYAWKGGNAFMNNKQIHVSKAPTVADSLIATGFPYYDFDQMRAFMGTLEYLFQNSHGVRRIGSAATDLAYVACGRFDSFYEYNLNPWDVAAGALIVKEAGGQVSDFKGGSKYLFGREIIASNNNTHKEFLALINKYFYK